MPGENISPLARIGDKTFPRFLLSTTAFILVSPRIAPIGEIEWMARSLTAVNKASKKVSPTKISITGRMGSPVRIKMPEVVIITRLTTPATGTAPRTPAPSPITTLKRYWNSCRRTSCLPVIPTVFSIPRFFQSCQ